jgi:hypothetical protein
VQQHRPLLERGADPLQQGHAVRGGPVVRFAEELRPVAARRLRRVEREVGVGERGVDATPMLTVTCRAGSTAVATDTASQSCPASAIAAAAVPPGTITANSSPPSRPSSAFDSM